jgi:hypothetical protein
MITYSIIKKSQLEGSSRLDAEYYQPEYFIDFTKGKWLSIGELLEICQYGISQAMNEENIGYSIFKMNDINNAFLFDDDVKCVNISEQTFNQFELKKNDVLFNRVNAEEFVGRTGIFKLDGDYTFASYLIRLRTNKNLLPDYLNIFLNSNYGIKQIKRFRRRAVNQANVNAEELKQIKIAILPQKFQEEIEKLANSSWDHFEAAKFLYQQAEDLLLESLGLKGFETEDNLSSIIKLSEAKKANRIDAEYFQPKYEKLLSKIKNKKLKSLLEIVENVPAKFNPMTKPEKSFKYVELANINSSIGTIDGFSEVFGKEAPSRAKRLLKISDVIVSSVEGSLGKVALVDEDQKDYLASTGFFSLEAKRFYQRYY